MPVTRTRVICVDSGTYMGAYNSIGGAGWMQPATTQYAPPSPPPPGVTESFVVSGLKEGTRWTCTLSSYSAVGGVDEGDYYRTLDAVVTLEGVPDAVGTISPCAMAPDAIVRTGTSTTTCNYRRNSWYGMTSLGCTAPGTLAPSLQAVLTWDTPRPNKYTQALVGPESYEVGGSAGSANVTGAATPTQTRTLSQRAQPRTHGPCGSVHMVPRPS